MQSTQCLLEVNREIGDFLFFPFIFLLLFSLLIQFLLYVHHVVINDCLFVLLFTLPQSIFSANMEAEFNHYLEKSVILISTPSCFQLAQLCFYIILTPVLCWCVSPFHVADYHDRTPSQSERSGVTHTYGVVLCGRMHFWKQEKGHCPCTLPTSTTGDMLTYTRRALPPP